MKNVSLTIKTVLLSATLSLALPALAAEKTALKPYTVEKCMVSDEKLGEMGKPYVLEYKGREIKFCCKDCAKSFKKDPEKYLKKLDQAEAAQSKSKPAKS